MSFRRLYLFWSIALLISLSGCARDIASGLDEAEANRAIVALQRANIEVEKAVDSEGKFKLSVARDDARLAFTILASEEIPRRKEVVANSQSMVPSPETERAQRIAATASQIERSLSSIDGVLDARVHLDVPAQDPLAIGPEQARMRPTASVLIRYRVKSPPVSIDDIKKFVSFGVAGLAHDDVAVVMINVPSPQPAENQQFGYIGPLAISRSSLPLAKVVSFVGLAVIGLLAAAVLFLLLQVRRVRRLSELAESKGAP